MFKCAACGKDSILPSQIGSKQICKICASKLELTGYKKGDYSTVEELMAKRDIVISKLRNNGFLEDGIKGIEEYFQSIINEGFIIHFDGKCGQSIKVFNDYVIINTKNEMQKTGIVNLFSQLLPDEEDEEDDLFVAHGDKIVRGLMSGKLLQTGIGIMTSNAVKEKQREKREEMQYRQLERMVVVGDVRINLHNVSSLEVYSKTNTANGYLRFIYKGQQFNDYYSSAYFFFNNSIPFESKKLKQKVVDVKSIIENNISAINEQSSQNSNISNKNPKTAEDNKQGDEININTSTNSNSDVDYVITEIRKFKALYDDGIITDEEFTAKKKQLLGI